MSNFIQKQLAKLLKEYSDKLLNGTCEINEEQMSIIMNLLGHEPVSKDVACDLLHLNRSKFEKLVRLNILPKGRKRKGFKELVWYKDELKNKYQEYKDLEDN